MSTTVPFPARNGIGIAAAYQVSGLPWMSGSASAADGVEVRFQFPFVSRAITVVNRSATDIRVHFVSAASGNVVSGYHYVTLSEARDSITFNVKSKEIYITPAGGVGAFEVFAELTTIGADQMYALTGSGITQ